MWLNIYQNYYLIYLKQLKYKNFILINFSKNWFFFNVFKKNIRLFILFKIILVTQELLFFRKKNAKFLTTNSVFILFQFYVFLIPNNTRQLIDSKMSVIVPFFTLHLNNFFQLNNVPRNLFFLTTFKKLKFFWVFQKALLVK